MEARLIHCWVNQRLGMQGKEKRSIHLKGEGLGWSNLAKRAQLFGRHFLSPSAIHLVAKERWTALRSHLVRCGRSSTCTEWAARVFMVCGSPLYLGKS
jgi:hypothetical protein